MAALQVGQEVWHRRSGGEMVKAKIDDIGRARGSCRLVYEVADGDVRRCLVRSEELVDKQRASIKPSLSDEDAAWLKRLAIGDQVNYFPCKGEPVTATVIDFNLRQGTSHIEYNLGDRRHAWLHPQELARMQWRRSRIGALQPGSSVKIFAGSSDGWKTGHVQEVLAQNKILVEYETKRQRFRKRLRIHRAELSVPQPSEGEQSSSGLTWLVPCERCQRECVVPSITMVARSAEECSSDDECDPEAFGGQLLAPARAAVSERPALQKELYKAAKAGNVGGVQELVDLCDPAMLLPEGPTKSSALHVAAHYGHVEVLVVLLETMHVFSRGHFSLEAHKNGTGESLHDIVTRCCNGNRAESDVLKRVVDCFSDLVAAGASIRVAEVPQKTLQQARKSSSKPFDFEAFGVLGVEDAVRGLKTEWEYFVQSPIDIPYQSWCTLRQDVLEDYAREVPEDGLDKNWSQRASVEEMEQRLLEAAGQGAAFVFRSAIWAYTLHSFVQQAVDAAMQIRGEDRFVHLESFNLLLHHAVNEYAKSIPFKGVVYKAMSLDESSLESFLPHESGDVKLDVISWSSFVLACKCPRKAIDNLQMCGGSCDGKLVVLFVIRPDERGKSDRVFPADITSDRDCPAAYGPSEEVLYPLGQQFQVIQQRRVRMAELPALLRVDAEQAATSEPVVIVELRAAARG